jgi:hypothetical protein
LRWHFNPEEANEGQLAEIGRILELKLLPSISHWFHLHKSMVPHILPPTCAVEPLDIQAHTAASAREFPPAMRWTYCGVLVFCYPLESYGSLFCQEQEFAVSSAATMQPMEDSAEEGERSSRSNTTRFPAAARVHSHSHSVV